MIHESRRRQLASRILELAIELNQLEQDYMEGNLALEELAARTEKVWNTIKALDQSRQNE